MRDRGGDGDVQVIPLLLPGMKPASLGNWFDVEPVAVPIELAPGGLAALGERLPTEFWVVEIRALCIDGNAMDARIDCTGRTFVLDSFH